MSLNWGDKDSAERLAAQLKELLRDRTMTYDQLASCYSIKHGQSVTQRLKEMSRDKPMSLGDFVTEMVDDFEIVGRGNQVKGKKATEPTVQPRSLRENVVDVDDKPLATMKYADVSRGIQNILKERQAAITCDTLEKIFNEKFGTTIEDVVGMTTGEYLQRKENIFDYNADTGTVFLQPSMLSGPPMEVDSSTPKDETFVVKEFEALIEGMGPVVYISTLCGKFIQRNGISVTSIINTRPLDLFKRHPEVFLIVGAGNVTLKKYEHLRDVQKLLDKPSSKAQRIAKAAEESIIPIPEDITEAHVVEEFRRLILSDQSESVYISSLCGRFLQRFKKPVTGIIDCKPAEFLRRYPDVFVMTGGGNVGLKEILGPDAVSVPPPPPRMPKANEDRQIAEEQIRQIELTDEVFSEMHTRLQQQTSYQAVVQRLMAVCRQIEQTSFLALEEVVLGGAAGKGLVTSGPQAELVLFVRQLPFRGFAQWLPHILETLAPVLEHQLKAQRAEKFKVDKDSLKFQIAGGTAEQVDVQIYLSPVFQGREHLLECIRSTPPAERFYFYPAFVKERNDFVGQQNADIKITVRLMTWWASKQRWASAFSTPIDYLLELVVIHAYQTMKEPMNQAGMVNTVLDLLASFETIKVLWADRGAALYQVKDIWRPLTSHEPLFMDPLNPYSNLADVNFFDSHDLTVAAQKPGAFICFQREASKFLPRPEQDVENGDYDDEDE